jgi:hypothetical protein
MLLSKHFSSQYWYEQREFLFVNLFLIGAFLLPFSWNSLFLFSFIILIPLLGISKSKVGYLPIIGILVIFISYLCNINTIIPFKEIQRLFVILIAFIAFPLNVQISQVSLKVFFLITIYTFVFQIGSALDIPSISEFINQNYPLPDVIGEGAFNYGVLENIEQLSEFRAGGIFGNPNIQGQYSIALLILALIKYKGEVFSKRNYIILISIIFICTISIVLTGSRTAFLTLLVVVLTQVKKKQVLRYAPFIAIVLIIAFITINKDWTNSFRVFDVTDDGSASYKWDILKNYVNNTADISKFIFGNIWDGKYQFDADIGYIFYSFGIFGVIGIFIYYYITFKVMPQNLKFIYCFALYMLTATIVFNFKVILLWTFMIGLVYTSKKELNIQKNIN